MGEKLTLIFLAPKTNFEETIFRGSLRDALRVCLVTLVTRLNFSNLRILFVFND
jgi:hypothetical protein